MRTNRINRRSLHYAALERTACAPFREERRMNFTETTKFDRKSGESREELLSSTEFTGEGGESIRLH